jgi:hypothetical protein
MSHRIGRGLAFAWITAVLLAAGPAPSRAQESSATDQKPAAGQKDAPAGEEKAPPVVGKWVPSLESGITLTQGSFSSNWVGGDQGSLIWSLITNAGLESQVTTKFNWRNTLKLAYGQTHQQVANPNGTRTWDQPEKSTDMIDFESIGRFTLGGFVDPFLAARFQSQFQDASDPGGRNLSFNPLQFSESAGIARQFTNEKDHSLLTRLGFTFRENSRRMFLAPPPDPSTRRENTTDGGVELVTDGKNGLLQKRVTWTTRLSIYQPLYYSGKSVLNDLTPEQLAAAGIDPDVAKLSTFVSTDWENIFSSQITKVISVTLYTRWVFDQYDNSVKPLVDAEGNLTNPETVHDAVRKAGQFKETLSLGVTYRFL